MKRAAIAAGLLLLSGAALAAQRRAVVVENEQAGQGAGSAAGDWWEPVSAAWQDLQTEVQTMGDTLNTINDRDTAQRNVSAFLEAIARAEGTAQRADPYRVCYGYRHTIISVKEHPAVSGEWKGERLSDDM